MTLPSLINSVGATTTGRAKDLTSSIATKIDPRRLAGQAAETIKGEVFSEMPELGALSSTIGSFVSDIRSNIGSDSGLSSETNTDAELKLIREESESQTSIFDSLTTWLKSIDSNLHGSPPYLLTIKDEIKDLLIELNVLTEITKNAWGVSQDQLDLTRQILAEDKKQSKRDRFIQQKDDAELKKPSKIPAIVRKKKEKGGLFHFLENNFLGRLLKGLGPVLGGVLSAFGLSAIAKRLIPGLIVKAAGQKVSAKQARKLGGKLDKNGVLRNQKGQFTTVDKLKAEKLANKKPSKFTKAFKGTAKSKGFIKIAKGTLKLARVAGRATPLAGAIMALDAVVGGFQAGVESYQKGNKAEKIVADALFGALKGVVSGLFETLKFFVADIPVFLFKVGKELFDNFSVFMDKNVTKPAAAKLKELGGKIGEAFANMRKAFMDSIKSMINIIVDKTHIRRFLPEAANNFLDTGQQTSTQSSISSDESKLPQSLTPQSRQAPIAANMITSQKTITDAQLSKIVLGNGASSTQLSPTVVAPIMNNLQTTNIIAKNIHTRNTESPVFAINRYGI